MPTFLFPETLPPPPPPYSLDTSPPLYTPDPDRSNSTSTVSTHAIPFSPGVTFTRSSTQFTGDEDEIIIVTVRISPPPSTQDSSERNSKKLLKRLHLPSSTNKPKVKAIKMPRSEYSLHFAHDMSGTYIGTSPQRPWTLEQLETEYGKFQTMPIASRYRTAI